MDSDSEPRQRDADRPIHQVRSDGRIVGEIRFDTPIFVISVAAGLAGMHAQTLRSYDRDGLVSPRRTRGGGRRYSQRDIELLQQVQELSQDDGVNRAGIRRIMELETHLDALRDKIGELAGELESLHDELDAARTGAAPPRESGPGGGVGDRAPSGGASGAREPGAGTSGPGAGAARGRSRPGTAIVAVRGAIVPFRAHTTTVVRVRQISYQAPHQDLEEGLGEGRREGAPDGARDGARETVDEVSDGEPR